MQLFFYIFMLFFLFQSIFHLFGLFFQSLPGVSFWSSKRFWAKAGPLRRGATVCLKSKESPEHNCIIWLKVILKFHVKFSMGHNFWLHCSTEIKCVYVLQIANYWLRGGAASRLPCYTFYIVCWQIKSKIKGWVGRSTGGELAKKWMSGNFCKNINQISWGCSLQRVF